MTDMNVVRVSDCFHRDINGNVSATFNPRKVQLHLGYK